MVCFCYLAENLVKEAADLFLATYEQEMGRPVANLGFWELATAVRPAFTPDGWIFGSTAVERFADFVDTAVRRSCLYAMIKLPEK
jgi:hypothetical protein